MNHNAVCWINQTIKPAHEATISVFDHGLLYGDGIFEGLRFYQGRTFMLEAHLQRLQASADAIGLELPYDLEQIAEAMMYLIEHPQEASVMGENGRRAVLETYNWEQESAKLLRIYEAVLGPRPPAAVAR